MHTYPIRHEDNMTALASAVMTKEEAGAYFKALRLKRKLRLQDVVEGTTIPNAQYLSALEGGRYNILNSEHFTSLVKFFRLSPEEVQKLNPDAIITFTAISKEPHDEISSVANVHKVPVIGMAAAGYGVDTETVEPIAWDYVDSENYRPHMLILQIDGNSMEKSGEVNSLNTGDWIYVDPRMIDLQDNKIFVVHIPSQGIVAKRVRKWPQGWVLVSDNHEYPPFTVDEAQIIGRVYYRQPKGEKL